MPTRRLRIPILAIIVIVLGVGATAWAAGPNIKTYTGCLNATTGLITSVQQGSTPLGSANCPSGSTKISISGGDITEVRTAPGSGLTGGAVNGSASLGVDFPLVDGMYVNEADAAPTLNWRGAWGAAVAYVPNDVVLAQGSSYVAIVASTNAAPATNPSKWQLMAKRGTAGAAGAAGAQGAQGAQGATGAPGLVWRGTWNATTSYAVGDAVARSGASYIAIVANTNAVPASNPTKWQVLAKKGAAGQSGIWGFNWMGEWDAAHQYSLGDVVSYAGSIYFAGPSTLTGFAPPDDPGFWTTLATAGANAPEPHFLSIMVYRRIADLDCVVFSGAETVVSSLTEDGSCALEYPAGTLGGLATAHVEWATLDAFLINDDGSMSVVVTPNTAFDGGPMMVMLVAIPQ